MKSDQTFEEYQHLERKKSQAKNAVALVLVLILFSIFLYFFYEFQDSRERSIYGSGQVIAVSDISTRGKPMIMCKVQLETGEQIDAICNSDAYQIGKKKVTIEKIQTFGELFIYHVKDTLIDDLTHRSSGAH